MAKQLINSISIDEARKIALHSQGLLSNSFKNKTLHAIEHLGYVQIDTLSVVARAHHHTLWSRLSNYKESDLHHLLEKDKRIFEYWSHAASYLPMTDYRFSLPIKAEYSKGKSHWFAQDLKIKKFVLEKIKKEGALQSKDFEHIRKTPGNWYEWKPAKRALEQLFMEGELMVAKRQGFQKVYDLTERVLPDWVDTKSPSSAEYAAYLIRTAIHANGIVTENEIAYLRKGIKPIIQKVIKQMLESKELIALKIKNKDELYYSSTNILSNSLKINDEQEVNLLSPFDNAVIQRKRLQTIFNFDYTIECYVPEAKRVYGYFCLPILYGTEFIGRLDPKADRKAKIFYVKNMYFEKGFKPDTAFTLAFINKLKEFASFNACTKIEFNCVDKKWQGIVRKMIK